MVSKREIALLFSCCVETLFFSGIIAGFSSLEYILVIKGVYADKGCLSKSQTDMVMKDFKMQAEFYKNVTEHNFCKSQIRMLTIAFDSGQLSGLLSFVLLGALLDKFGVRIFKGLNCFVFGIGIACIAFTEPGTDWLIFPGMLLIAISSLIVMSCNLKIVPFFRGYETIVATFISGCFDSSAVNFEILKQAFVHGFSSKLFLLIYGLLGISMFLVNGFLYPGDKPADPPKEVTEKSALTSSDSDSDVGESSKKTPPFREVLFSAKFGFFVLCFASLYLIFYTLVSGHNVIIRKMFDKLEAVYHYSAVFALTLMFGVVVSPLPALTFYIHRKCFPQCQEKERIHRTAIIPFFIACTLGALAFICLSLVPRATFFIYVFYVVVLIFRTFTFATSYSYLATAFPTVYIGKLFGVTYLAIALSVVIQFLLVMWLTKSHFALFLLFGLALVAMSNPIYILKAGGS